MRILDRYAVRQLLPVWIWCLVIFIFLSCLIDLFGRLDEIIRYHLSARMVLSYYLHFIPVVWVWASPVAVLLSAAFVAMRLARYHELLAMSASGVSPLRAAMPFLFIGWVASLLVFFVKDLAVPKASAACDRLQRELFRDDADGETSIVDNVALIDSFNRLYHARELDRNAGELRDLTVLEHDAHNRPIKSLYANRAVWTRHGWLLLSGTIYAVGPQGQVLGDPQSFVDRLIPYPVTPESFLQPEAMPETMRYRDLRLLIRRLRQMGTFSVRRYAVELVAKITLPLVNLVICLVGFVGAAQPGFRGNLRGVGVSLGWGVAYYLLVAASHAVAKRWPVPIMPILWLPHVAAFAFFAWKLQPRRLVPLRRAA